MNAEIDANTPKSPAAQRGRFYCYTQSSKKLQKEQLSMPASQRQIDANRRNASGPHKMSEAGKAALRLNPVTHGLTAQPQLILPGEDPEAFHELRDALLADYAPGTTQERILVQQVAESYWRLLRARNMETGSLATTLINQRREMNLPDQPGPDSDTGPQLALAYAKNDFVFAKLGRYETAIERSYFRAIRELNRLQAERRRHAAEIRSVSQSVGPVPAQPASEIRSASQSVEIDPKPALKPTFHISEPVARALRQLPPDQFARVFDNVVCAPLPGLLSHTKKRAA